MANSSKDNMVFYNTFTGLLTAIIIFCELINLFNLIKGLRQDANADKLFI